MTTIQSETTLSLTTQLKALIQQKHSIQSETRKITSPLKEYKPRQHTIDKLSEVNPALEEMVALFSFSQHLDRKVLQMDTWMRMLKLVFPFTHNQMDRMSGETIATVKAQGLKGILASFHEYREKYFSYQEIIESDFEEKRLEYLYQDAPFYIYTNEEYEYIRFHLVEMFTEAIEIYFDFPNRGYSASFINIRTKFYFKMLEKFETLSNTVLLFLQKDLFDKIKNERCTDIIIMNYSKYRVPLLTWEISYSLRYEEGQANRNDSINAMLKLFYICTKHPQTVVRFLTNESANQLMNYLIDFVKLDEYQLSYLANKSYADSLMSSVNTIVDTILPFIEIVESEFHNFNK